VYIKPKRGKEETHASGGVRRRKKEKGEQTTEGGVLVIGKFWKEKDADSANLRG